eukprot:CCRYP_001271-RA/>CCRYP_001271-RA protein AED:0.39 eAED:0.39 QI:0/-1/0/1/-1/1/1/0/198
MPQRSIRHCRRSSDRIVLLPLLLLALVLTPKYLKPVDGTQVKWSSNENVSPKDRAAHDAPRSQKYWDEHGIERPDYAKTDEEIAAERRQNGDSKWQTWLGTSLIAVYVVFGILAISTIAYAVITGDWGVIKNNQVTAFLDRFITQVMESGGMKGQKLGSSAETTQTTTGGVSEEEKLRIARLARFDNPRDMLDSMKED